MAEKEVLFKSEENKTRGEIAAFLRQIADKVETGVVSLTQGEREVILNLPENLILEIKAERKVKPEKSKHSLEIEIEWRGETA